MSRTHVWTCELVSRGTAWRVVDKSLAATVHAPTPLRFSTLDQVFLRQTGILPGTDPHGPPTIADGFHGLPSDDDAPAWSLRLVREPTALEYPSTAFWSSRQKSVICKRRSALGSSPSFVHHRSSTTGSGNWLVPRCRGQRRSAFATIVFMGFVQRLRLARTSVCGPARDARGVPNTMSTECDS